MRLGYPVSPVISRVQAVSNPAQSGILRLCHCIARHLRLLDEVAMELPQIRTLSTVILHEFSEFA